MGVFKWQWHQLHHHANNQHLAPDRETHQHLITQFLRAGCSSWCPTNTVKALKALSLEPSMHGRKQPLKNWHSILDMATLKKDPLNRKHSYNFKLLEIQVGTQLPFWKLLTSQQQQCLQLVGRQEEHPACKKTDWRGDGMVICLKWDADFHVA